MGFQSQTKSLPKSFPFKSGGSRGVILAPHNYKLYGKYVELTECQYNNLLLDLSRDEDALLSLISDFDLYMITHGIVYQNHYKILKRKVDKINENKLVGAVDYYKYRRFGVL